MKRFFKLSAISALLITGGWPAEAQTNFEFWVQSLNVALTGSTDGAAVTNGIVARVKSKPVRITSASLIKELSHKPTFTVAAEVFTNVVTITNTVHGTNVYVTNEVVTLTPVYHEVTDPVYSPGARLLVKTPLDSVDLGVLTVIRDGAADYVINDYFQMRTISFDGRTPDYVTTGKFDIVHDLVDVITSGIKGFTFNANGSTNVPPSGTYFDVQGFNTDRESGLVEGGSIIARSVSRASSTTVAGTGQVGVTNGFAVLHGTISATRGKHETR